MRTLIIIAAASRFWQFAVYCKGDWRRRAASNDEGHRRLRHPLVPSSAVNLWVGVYRRLLVPRGTSDLSPYISAARGICVLVRWNSSEAGDCDRRGRERRRALRNRGRNGMIGGAIRNDFKSAQFSEEFRAGRRRRTSWSAA